ncbi:MAG: cytidine deaminase [Fulvivirga sp.]|nr:cytidine deaminase [Fulvivirga sp.]
MESKSSEINNYLTFSSEAELSKEERALLQAAKNASKNSYSPYSGFQVGAAIRLSNGKIVEGSNQENAAYPSGLCAERVALFHASSNYNGEKITQITVAAKREDEEVYLPVTPCGGCRQVMLEFENKQASPIEVILRTGENTWIKTSSAKLLLPFSFDKNSL